MNIHLPAILGFTRYQGFDPSPYIKLQKHQSHPPIHIKHPHCIALYRPKYMEIAYYHGSCGGV